MTAKRDSLIRSILILTAVNLTAQLTGLVSRIGISRLAGAEVMGIYQMLMPAYSVMSAFAVSGLAVSVSALTGDLSGRRQLSGVRQLVKLALKSLCGLWALLTVPVVLFSDFISVSLLGDARTRLGLMVLLPCLLLTGVENIQKHFFYGVGAVKLPAAVELGEQAVRTAAILLLLGLVDAPHDEGRAALIICGMVCSEVFSAGALTLGRRRAMGPLTKDPVSGLGRRLLETAFPIGAAAVIANALGALNAIMIPGRLICSGIPAHEATAEYGVLFGMTLPILTLPTCFISGMCTVLLPDLSRMLAKGQREECRKRVSQSLQGAAKYLFPLLSLLAVFGGAVCRWVFQEDRAGEHLVLLVVGVAVTGLDVILSSALNGLGYQRQNAMAGILVGSGELLLTWYLVGKFGLTGCGWSLLLGGGVETLVRWLLCRKAVGLSLREMGNLLKPALAAVLTGLVVRLLWLGLMRYGLEDLTAMMPAALVGGGFYLLILHVEGEKLS